jgi:Peptidase family M41
MNRRESRKLLATAYHEAGHAVAAWELRLPTGITTIIPNDEQGSLGHCVVKAPKWLQPDIDVDARTSHWIERKVIVSYAGRAAEKLLIGRNNNIGASIDNRSAMNLASYVEFDPDILGVYLRLQHLRAQALVTRPTTRRFIEDVARALVEKRTLRPSEVQAIIRRAADDMLKSRR